VPAGVLAGPALLAPLPAALPPDVGAALGAAVDGDAVDDGFTLTVLLVDGALPTGGAGLAGLIIVVLLPGTGLLITVGVLLLL